MLRSIFRYCFAGALITAVYFVITAAAIELTHFPAIVCSLAGFVLALPVAYLGHRYFTFRSTGSHARELPRFVIATSTMFTVSSVSVVLFVNVLGTHYVIPLFVTSVLAPVINFATMKIWVFSGDCS